MPDQLAVRVPAKLNLYLEVLGRRPDGYHDVRTIMQAVSLYDRMSLRREPGGRISLRTSDPALPTDERNLVVRAAQLLKERGGVADGVSIDLIKSIPLGGGLGGGSADGAIALRALAELWGLGMDPQDLQEAAAELGSDVPFFLEGGTALCEGRGERVSPLECPQPLHYVLILPGRPLSTAQVYAAAESNLTKPQDPIKLFDRVKRALRAGDVGLLGSSLRNDLQAAALAIDNALWDIWRKLKEVQTACEAEGLSLSGSGSSFYMLARGEREASRAADLLASALAVPCAVVHSLPSWGSHFSALALEEGLR